MADGAGFRVAHLRDMAAHFRSLASLEPLESLRRHLRRLAAQHDEAAANLEIIDRSGQTIGAETDSCFSGSRSS
jgi:hypothetical protein